MGAKERGVAVQLSHIWPKCLMGVCNKRVRNTTSQLFYPTAKRPGTHCTAHWLGTQLIWTDVQNFIPTRVWNSNNPPCGKLLQLRYPSPRNNRVFQICSPILNNWHAFGKTENSMRKSDQVRKGVTVMRWYPKIPRIIKKCI
jgi:hypothetical protein